MNSNVTNGIEYKLQTSSINNGNVINEHKLITSRKPNNIMSISDDFGHDVLKYNSNKRH